MLRMMYILFTVKSCIYRYNIILDVSGKFLHSFILLPKMQYFSFFACFIFEFQINRA